MPKKKACSIEAVDGDKRIIQCAEIDEDAGLLTISIEERSCRSPTLEEHQALSGLAGAVRAGIIGKGERAEAFAERLDDLDVPWFVQNRVAYEAETTEKYVSDIIEESFVEYCDYEKKRKRRKR